MQMVYRGEGGSQKSKVKIQKGGVGNEKWKMENGKEVDKLTG